MKLSLGIFLLAFVGASVAQEPTITEDLRAAQTDLTVGHEFAETLLSLNRGQISAYMHVISRALIDSHINAYSHMKDQILETNATLDAIVVTEQNEACMNSVWNRWNLQTARFGQRLAACLRIANNMLNGWDGFLLNVHVTGQVSANQVANLGLMVLSDTDVFESMEQYQFLINTQFRYLLRRIRPYRDTFDGFLEAISNTQEEVIRILADCDRALEEDLETEINEDLSLARNCELA